MFDKFKKILTFLLIILLLLSIVVMGAPTYVNVGPTTDFEGDVGVPDGSGYYINDILFSTVGLIDISTLAKTDSNFIVGYGTNWVAESGATARASLGIDLTLYYLKTEIDTLSEVEAIYTKNIIDSDELATLKFTDLDDTPANYTGQAGKYIKVNAGETDLEFGTPAGGGTYLELTDTPAAYDNGKYAKSTADGVIWDTPSGAGDMLKAVYDTDADNIVDKAETVDDGVGNSSTAADVKDAVTKKHTQNTDTAAGGEWDFGAHSAGFTIQTANGDGTTTIDWTLGNYFKFTHGAMSETFTFNPAPTKPSHLTLIIIQDGVGGRDSTWPAPVKWLGGEPTWTDGGAGKGIVVAMVYDGTNYWSQGTPWEE